MDGVVLEEKESFNMLWLFVSSKLDWGSYIFSIAKTTSKKIGACIRSMKLFYSEVSLYSLPHSNAWNTIIMSALVPPSGTQML